MKKGKIIATIGPATEHIEMIEKLSHAGVDIFRLNFSHDTFIIHQHRLNHIREVSEKTGIPSQIIQDLGGPKIRIGMFDTEHITLVPGKLFTLTTDDIEGDENHVSVSYPLLPEEVLPGEMIFLNDGRNSLKVKEIKGNDVVCEVVVGGVIKGKRGVNLPHSELSIKSLTDKDVHDLEFGIKNNVDFMALSFVRRASDIIELRDILKDRGVHIQIIAKIETPQAVLDIDAIISATDAVMIARGDLAIEVPFEKVPEIQKMIIKKCNEAGKFVIVATQMLESMVKNSVPTRAETSDIANAILDGANAVMLSEETALGHYPVEAVEVMSKIVDEYDG